MSDTAAAPTTPAPATIVGEATTSPAPAAGDATAKPTGDAKGVQQTQAQPDAATKGDQPADQKPANPAKDSAAEVEIKLPEGVRIDEQAMGAVKTLAKEHGLKSEVAQKFVDLHLGALQQMQKAQAEAQAQQSADWRKAIETDKTLGGDNLSQTKANVSRAFNRFASPELVKVLESTGLGNHPELVRLFAAIGAADAEDTIAGTTAGGAGQGEMSRADFLKQMYPNNPK